MGHPKVENGTPFAFEPLFVADEEGRPVIATIVKATFRFDATGTIWLDEAQVPVNFTGEPSSDAPDASYRYEPETAFFKVATDVVLVGHARPPSAVATVVDVGIRVGRLSKLARVFGDRYWVMANGTPVLSRTGELRPIPLTWEHAFGGCDEPRSTPDRPMHEARNPVGAGFGQPLLKDGDNFKLPNIEDPTQLLVAYGTVVTPCGFGFTSPHWQPRASLAGTYDEEWDARRKPLLPVDFDRRFFNAAAPGLIAPGYLLGNEEVVVLNTTPAPRLAFHLPALAPPRAVVALRGRGDVELTMHLDTVIVNTDQMQLMLLWRGHAQSAGGPHDVTAIKISPSS